MKKTILYIGIIALALAGCKKTDVLPDVEAAYCPSAISITLSEHEESLIYLDPATGVNTLPMLVGETFQLGWNLEPDTATFRDVIWVSSSTQNVSVNDRGQISAISAAGLGYSVISVTPKGMYSGSGVSASLRVKVSATMVPATAISIAPVAGTDSSLFIGDQLPLQATILPDAATYRTVDWVSLNEDIATVDAQGIVTGISTNGKLNATATIVATAKDGSGVSAQYTVRVKNVVDPESVTLSTDFSKDNYVCCMYDKSVSISYTTYPDECTTSKIVWTCSQPDIATVVDGVVYLNQNGKFGDFTITATCPNGQSDEITMTMPAGLLRETFHNENNITWGISNTDKQEWHDGYLTCTTTATNATNQRADFMAKTPIYICSGNYPIIMFRMEYVNDKYAEVTSSSFKFDTNGKDVESGTEYRGEIGGGNNKWSQRWKCSDGTSVFIYDLRDKAFPTGGVLPTTAIVKFTTFQIKYADMRTLDHEVTYDVHRVQSFHNIDEVRQHLTAEGLSWTE